MAPDRRNTKQHTNDTMDWSTTIMRIYYYYHDVGLHIVSNKLRGQGCQSSHRDSIDWIGAADIFCCLLSGITTEPLTLNTTIIHLEDLCWRIWNMRRRRILDRRIPRPHHGNTMDWLTAIRIIYYYWRDVAQNIVLNELRGQRCQSSHCYSIT